MVVPIEEHDGGAIDVAREDRKAEALAAQLTQELSAARRLREIGQREYHPVCAMVPDLVAV